MGRRDTLLLSILTLVTTAGWITFDVYHSYADSTITTEVEEQISSITPTFKSTVIDSIKKRQDIEPLTTVETSFPTPSESLESATISAEEKTATQSGGR